MLTLLTFTYKNQFIVFVIEEYRARYDRKASNNCIFYIVGMHTPLNDGPNFNK